MLAKHLDLNAPLHWTVEGVLSPEACKELLRHFQGEPMEPAPINTGGAHRREDLRNNHRLLFEDARLAADLGRLLAPTIPSILRGHPFRGLNPRFRVYRYELGEYFGAHFDEPIHQGQVSSLLTVLVYLNDDFVGGGTRFLDLGVTVQPKMGMALLFQHHLLHEGLPVLRGSKWVLRTEAFYEKDSR